MGIPVFALLIALFAAALPDHRANASFARLVFFSGERSRVGTGQITPDATYSAGAPNDPLMGCCLRDECTFENLTTKEKVRGNLGSGSHIVAVGPLTFKGKAGQTVRYPVQLTTQCEYQWGVIDLTPQATWQSVVFTYTVFPD